MTKGQRSDSLAGEIETMKNAMTKIDPPDWCIMPDGALPFWHSITRARSADRWNESDLEAAAELARTKFNIERLNKELLNESDIIYNERGTQIVNPKHALLETLTRRVVALSRLLQVHAEATQGKSRDQVKRNKAQQSARQAIENMDDGLIARPKH